MGPTFVLPSYSQAGQCWHCEEEKDFPPNLLISGKAQGGVDSSSLVHFTILALHARRTMLVIFEECSVARSVVQHHLSGLEI